MTNKHLILTETCVNKARSMHMLTQEERYVAEELHGMHGLPWDGAAETLDTPIVPQQDQGRSGRRRVYLATNIVKATCNGTLRHTVPHKGHYGQDGMETLADALERVEGWDVDCAPCWGVRIADDVGCPGCACSGPRAVVASHLPERRCKDRTPRRHGALLPVARHSVQPGAVLAVLAGDGPRGRWAPPCKGWFPALRDRRSPLQLG